MNSDVQKWTELNIPDDGRPSPFENEDICFGYVTYDHKSGVFHIFKCGDDKYPYSMEASRIACHGRGFLDFLLQVHSKEWCTAQHILDLLNCVTCWAVREHGEFPQKFFGVCAALGASITPPPDNDIKWFGKQETEREKTMHDYDPVERPVFRDESGGINVVVTDSGTGCRVSLCLADLDGRTLTHFVFENGIEFCAPVMLYAGRPKLAKAAVFQRLPCSAAITADEVDCDVG